jgi:hypothetical protein
MFVPVFFRMTLALDTTRPLGSVTVPLTVA